MKKKTIFAVMAICLLLSLIPLAAAAAAPSDAMPAINAAHLDKRQGTQTLENDGYIGIPVELSLYFDTQNHTVKSGYGGTPVILYVVNANFERIGTQSDAEIIESMLARGYIVVTVDYKNDSRAASPALDTSLQHIRSSIEKRTYFKSFMPSGTYYDHHVVPAGYNVTLNAVFWEADKHGTDGTLERIVENWNNDFRGTKKNSLVKWVRPDGTRKKVANASDNTAPVWYNSSGATDPFGEYTKVKWTVAETIEDCVNPDGTPIDLNLYMHVIYPTSPAEDVPVMCLASSSGYLAKVSANIGRPHLNGFAFNGYAVVSYDYLYVPMARDDSFGYYDGKTSSGSVTGDQMTYSVHIFNDKEINTAAMRYIRYLSLSDERYSFKLGGIGVHGNSKGGWMTFLGERVLQSPLVDRADYASVAELEEAISRRITSFWETQCFEGHHGETRYENGDTGTTTRYGVTIDGGELQPWLTYNGEEILSGANMIYASNGSNEEDVSAGHAPIFVALHLEDTYKAAYGNAGTFVNLCRTMNIPSLFFEVPLGHTLTHGEDLKYGVDTYLAFFDFAGYHLKGDAVKVAYATPLCGAGDVSVTSDIIVKFTGPVSSSEIEKVTVTDRYGNLLSGAWSSLYGDTEWTFSPSAMQGDMTYTVTVPASLCGDNGAQMGEEFSTSFRTEACLSVDSDVLSQNYAVFTIPKLPSGAEEYKLRFYVSNDAANIVNIYKCERMSDEGAKRVGTVNISGAGYYELDVTSLVKDSVGEQAIFLIKAQKSSGTVTHFSADFSKTIASCSKTAYSTVRLGDGVLETVIKPNTGKYTNNVYYENPTVLFTNNAIINRGSAISASDYGRRYTVSFKVYSDASRVLQVRLNSCMSSSEEIIDYDMNIYNYHIEAGQWQTISFEYEVYDTEYGTIANRKKSLSVGASPDGDRETPVYFDDLSVVETITDVTVSEAQLVMRDGYAVAPQVESPITVYGSDGSLKGSYTSLRAALSAYQHGDTLKLNSDYEITGMDNFSDFSFFAAANGADGHKFIIDLGGYTLSNPTDNPLLALNARTPSGKPMIQNTEITLKNGRVLLGKQALLYVSATDTTATGKVFDINLESLEIGLLPNATTKGLILSSKITSSALITANIALRDCVINIEDECFKGSRITLMPSGVLGLSANYFVDGGVMEIEASRRVAIAEDATRVKFIVSGDGTYTTVRTPLGQPNVNYSIISPSDTTYIPTNMQTDSGTAVFMPSRNDGGVTTYSLIPSAYADKSAYPFLVFNGNGAFVGAATQLYGANSDTSAIGAAKQYLKANVYDKSAGGYGENELSAYVYMRCDYTVASGEYFNNIAQIQGALTLYLGGHTITLREGEELIRTHAKPWPDSGDEAVFPTSVVICNGTVHLNNTSLLELQAWDATGDGGVEEKTMSFTFRDVVFDAKGSTDLSSLMSSFKPSSQTPDATAKFSLTLDDCVFDIREAASTIPVLLFDASNANMALSVTVNGGRIIAAEQTKFLLMSVNDENSFNRVLFGKGDAGNLLRVAFTDEGASPDASVQYQLVGGGIGSLIRYEPTGEYRICVHSYSGDCDEYCDLCTARRETPAAQHAFLNVCDSSCAICGQERDEAAEHSYVLKNDGTGHWYACSTCGLEKINSFETHRGGATCIAEKRCAVCGYHYATLAPTSEHQGIYVSVDSELHRLSCSVCGEWLEAEGGKHIFESVDDGEGNRRGVCTECGYEIPEGEMPSSAPVGLIIGVSAGAVLLAAAAVIVIAVVRKRRK